MDWMVEAFSVIAQTIQTMNELDLFEVMQAMRFQQVDFLIDSLSL
jgi:hypothetical protein